MRRRIVGPAAFIVVVAAAPAVHAQPAMSWQPASSRNYTAMSSRNIDMIVIHKAEGSLDGTVSWFQNSAAGASAHYVVSASEIVQTVRDHNVAWHAGNHAYNLRSIGIENEGYNFRDDFTDAHYRRLAELVAYLCNEYSIPIDRQHIIGHKDVPNPYRPGMFGGADGHQCPGPYFKWSLFMSYVQQYAGGSPAPAPTPTPTPTPTATAPSSSSGGAQGVSVTASALNVRDAAGGNVIGTAAQSTGWALTGNEDQGFSEISFRGTTAWVYSSYLTGYSGTGAHIDTDGLNVRAAPSGTIVGHAYSGQVYVESQTSADGAWVLVRFDENRRWVYKSYTTDVALTP